MELSIYQVDAFSDAVFAGNPAAVCPLDKWLDDATMQAIAAENNLSETAFFVAADDGGAGHYELRWFTPTVEVDLCGHATLASAYVVFERLAPRRREVRFATRSGELAVAREGDMIVLDFPAYPGTPVAAPAALADGLGAAPDEVLEGPNYVAVFAAGKDVAALAPDFDVLAGLHPRGVIATAPGEAWGCDFVSRFFGPSFGIDEDPVTGSAHCMLTPYWAARLGRKRLDACQISARGGVLACEERGDRVRIGGRAALYLEGTIRIGAGGAGGTAAL